VLSRSTEVKRELIAEFCVLGGLDEREALRDDVPGTKE